ncbi:unnamed protein product [Alternaria alternata]
MGLHVDEKRACKEFLANFTTGPDPTWGFYVYATYTRPQEQKEADSDQNSSSDKTAMVDDNTYFQNLLDKFHDLATENLRDSYLVKYNQRIIDALRLVPADIMPNASLSEVCTHFRIHHARIFDSERRYEPGYQEAYDEEGLMGPKYEWCMVIDDEALENFDADDDYHTFAKLLDGEYVMMKKPVALNAKYRDGTGGTQWNGWFKFSAGTLREVFEVVHTGSFTTYFNGEDELLDF